MYFPPLFKFKNLQWDFFLFFNFQNCVFYMNLDIKTCRSSVNYTFRELFLRVLWCLAKFVFRSIPRHFYGGRNFILRLFGAHIGKDVRIYPSVTIFAPWHFSIGDESSIGFDAIIYNLGPITIGDRVTISQRAHLCAGSHDYTVASMPLTKPAIRIEDEVWVCADAFVGPGVTLGQGAVIAARSVVVKDIPPLKLVGGNPAKVLKDRVLCQN